MFLLKGDFFFNVNRGFDIYKCWTRGLVCRIRNGRTNQLFCWEKCPTYRINFIDKKIGRTYLLNYVVMLCILTIVLSYHCRSWDMHNGKGYRGSGIWFVVLWGNLSGGMLSLIHTLTWILLIGHMTPLQLYLLRKGHDMMGVVMCWSDKLMIDAQVLNELDHNMLAFVNNVFHLIWCPWHAILSFLYHKSA